MADINVEEVLSKLTTNEKIRLLAGRDFWHTNNLPDHGIPTLRFSDGPNGVRGTRFFNGVRSACFPCGTALGSTFDTELLLEAGKLMGKEAIVKGAHVLLGPCINMQRSPLGGRGFESLSEDPVVAGLGAAALVNGIQSTGVVATIKHFVTNDQEHERMAVSAIVTERALREIYLLPFQIAVRDSHPNAFMTAYNKLNGLHLSENHRILQGVLREEWKWRGLVMSDWFGTYSTSDAINAGLDLEMPGPTRWRNGQLGLAVSSRKVAQHVLDERVRGVLELVKRCAKSGVKEDQKEGKNDTPETAAILRKCASQSIVLFKNEDNILPLKRSKSVLVIGPNGKTSVFCGGGSSSMAPYYAVSPYDGIKAKIDKDAEVKHAQGCYSHKELPLVSNIFKRTKEADSPRGVVFRASPDAPGTENRRIVDELHLDSSYALMPDYDNPELRDCKVWYADIEGYFTADRTGDFELGVCVYGTGKLYVDGNLVVDNATKQRGGESFMGMGTVEEKGVYPMKEGQTYNVKLEFASAASSKTPAQIVVDFGGGCWRIGGTWILNMDETIKEAADLAKEYDQVVICAGLNSDWEGEGVDRKDMRMPGRLDDLVDAVATANPNAVVVLQTGTPIEMPWLSKIKALVQAWYGGNETGNGIADILFGDVNPSGRSSLSWPKRVQDNPAYYNYRSEAGRTLYGEDVYIGYRHYETVERDVNFSFGYGLSYTSFELSNLKASISSASPSQTLTDSITLTLDVANTGSLAGADVVLAYVRPAAPSFRRPVRELKGFAKVFVEAGGRKQATISVPIKYGFAFWDEIRDQWKVEKGKYSVLVEDGRGEQEPLVAEVDIAEDVWWSGL